MPMCISCTAPTPYLYTLYESEHNLRLEECRQCKAFVDPYVEFDALTLFIDLILLKRGVFRHLLFNRGSPPRRLGGGEAKKPAKQSHAGLARGELLLKLGGGLTLLDAYIRWCYLNPIPSSEPLIWTAPLVRQFFLILVGTLVETFAFQLTILALTYVFHRLQSSGGRRFTPTLVPLSLLYSSLTKYFLLFLLTIWPPSTSAIPKTHFPMLNSNGGRLFSVLDDDVLDKEWLVRNVVGGMSAGFGLRVVLDDIGPFFTTVIIIGAWAVKNLVSNVVGHSIGDVNIQRAWRSYSIP